MYNKPAAGATRGPYWQTWKGKATNSATAPYDNGTDNSGEIVEGAVAQVLWKLSEASAAGFAAKIEPVWKIVRYDPLPPDQATPPLDPDQRSAAETFEDFYDKAMTQNAGDGGASTRQAVRDASDEHGIVYSRLKITQVERVAGSGVWAVGPGVDYRMVGKKSNFEALPLTADELNLETVVDEVVWQARFSHSTTGSPNLIKLENVPFTDLDVSKFTTFDTVDRDTTAEFLGLLDAAELKNQYYIVRAAVEQGGNSGHERKDQFQGPFLEDAGPPAINDASGKTTATFWGENGIHWVIAIDKTETRIPGYRKPAP